MASLVFKVFGSILTSGHISCENGMKKHCLILNVTQQLLFIWFVIIVRDNICDGCAVT